MIAGKSILLRALEPSDIDLLYEWENNQDVWKISDTVQPFSRYSLEKYIDSPQDIFIQHQLRLVICLQSSGEAVGCIDLFDFNPLHRRVGIGILIADEVNRNRGIARESLALTIDYCFQVLDCHQIYCNITENNFRSINLFEKLGFERVGLKRDWIREEGGFINEFMYQLIKAQA